MDAADEAALDAALDNLLEEVDPPGPSGNASSFRHDDSDEDDELVVEEKHKPLDSSGLELKRLLAEKPTQSRSIADRVKEKTATSGQLYGTQSAPTKSSPTVFDPFFGLSVRSPSISSVVWQDYCEGSTRIFLSALRPGAVPAGNWVSMGVLVSKSDTKMSASGAEYLLWQLSDLKDCQSQPTRLLIFGDAVKTHWKTQTGSLIALSAPAFADGRPKDRFVTLKVARATQLTVIGQCTDFGICKGTRASDGAPCTAFVNRTVGPELCIFHVMSAAKRLSANRGAFGQVAPTNKRSAAAATNSPVFCNTTAQRMQPNLSKTPLTPKITRPNPNPGSTPLSIKAEKENLQQLLVERSDDPGARCLAAIRNNAQRADSPASVSRQSSSSFRDFVNAAYKSPRKSVTKTTPRKSPRKAAMPSPSKPCLGRSFGSNARELSLDSPQKSMAPKKPVATNPRQQAAVAKAIAVMRREREAAKNPETSKQRPLKRSAQENGSSQTNENSEANERSSGKEDVMARARAFLQKKSKFSDEAEKSERDAEARYMEAAEKREQIETRLVETMELKNVRVVSCKECNYTARHQSALCKSAGHKTRVHEATKRFFKCKECAQRTTAYGLLPTEPCQRCSATNWARVGMTSERKVQLDNEKLLLRGEERKFVGA